MRLKKMIVFVLVFTAVVGLTAVDEAYSEMMDQTGQATLHVRRVNSEYVTLSIFGHTADINTRQLHEDWDEISNTVTASLDNVVGNIHNLLGMEEEPLDYSVFKTEIL